MEIENAIKQEELSAVVHSSVFETAQINLQVIWDGLRHQFGDSQPQTAPRALDRIQQTLTAYHICLGKLEAFRDFRTVAVHVERKKRLAAKPRAPRGATPNWKAQLVAGKTYRDPVTGKEFTRGQKGAIPRGLREALAADKDPEQFLVKQGVVVEVGATYRDPVTRKSFQLTATKELPKWFEDLIRANKPVEPFLVKKAGVQQVEPAANKSYSATGRKKAA